MKKYLKKQTILEKQERNKKKNKKKLMEIMKTILKSILFPFWVCLMILSTILDSMVNIIEGFYIFLKRSFVAVRYVFASATTEIFKYWQ